ncbi:HlyD family secretion protein [Algibacter mikhailovii]|uniref:Multidrug transporter n=1 Tax=Algibacter mikhailovii TaxID=425498 RepID=A0A918VF31_9FLAO|nr:HlyD family secretion protein [Algibacter mikhailovii]GGZ92666.1 multidrug transporter [Algibacter mikhailovii]
MATETDSIPNNEEQAQEDASNKKEQKSPIKLITRIVLIVSLLFFVWYILAERHTPYTDQARIKGLVTPVTSRVSGNIIDVRIKLHTNVKAGDTLFLIDPSPFEIAVLKAEANIDNAVQSVAASSSSVKSAAGKLGVAKAQLERAQRNWNRVEKVMRENAGALSESDKDQSETALLQATEQVASSQANLDRAKQSLGDSGPDNPKIRTAIQELEKAQLDLAFTAIIAPTDGVIESFDIDLGYYASAGQPLTTLISNSDVWIQADMKENNLSLLKVGDPVKYTFDIAPGVIYEGHVRSLGYGVSADQTNKGGLPTINSKNSWLRDPQRFPVIISFDSIATQEVPIRLGGQVDVVAYTGNSWILNAIASFRIKFNSWLSYVR